MIKNNTKPHSHSTLEQSSVIIPLTTSEPDPILPPTLQLMKKYDYVAESTTGLSDIQLPFEELQEGVAKYGMLHTPGMPFEEYKEAMNREWIDVTDYDEEPEEITVDITETMNYDIYVETLKNYLGMMAFIFIRLENLQKAEIYMQLRLIWTRIGIIWCLCLPDRFMQENLPVVLS